MTLEVARRSMIFSLLAALVIAPAAYIIPLLYGDSFRPAIVTLWLLLPGVVALSYYKVLGVHMAGQGHPEFFSYAAGVSAVLTLSLDFLLIPFWGINGAAIASSIAYLLTAILSIRQFVRMTGMKRISRLFVPEPGDLRLFRRRLSGSQHVTKGM